MARLYHPHSRHFRSTTTSSWWAQGTGAASPPRAWRARGGSVCLLERGREYQPGEFPDTLIEAAAATQTDHEKGRLGSPTALFDFRTNEDVNVLVGCGLGGTR